LDADRNPYVGPQPFQVGESALFFGRVREVRDLTSLVVAHRVVLLYAASGAGKSSLINAGLLPALVDRQFQVMPPARVGAPGGDLVPTENVFAASLVAQWLEPGATSRAATAATFLAAHPRELDEDGEPQPRAVIVDQFEEVFTTHPEHWEQRADFFRQLREALEADDRLRLLLALREEYLAYLDPYATLLPTGLRTRFRLERLDHESALDAVTRPLLATQRSFAPAAADALVRNLRTVHVETLEGRTVDVEGEYVEPVQLQVVCRELWNRLPAEISEITDEHLRELADLDAVLGDFYEQALAAAMSRTRVGEPQLRTWVGRQLITPGETRSTVYRGAIETAGMPNAVVDTLDEKRLIRADERAGAKWYELTHDRLIGPIRASNGRFDADLQRNRRRRVLAAVLVLVAAASAAFAVAALWVFDLVGSQSSWPPPTKAERIALARRFAPILKLDSGEQFLPMSRRAFVSLTQLKQVEGRFARVVDATPTVGTLAATAGSCVPNRGCLYYLDVRGVEPDPPKRSDGAYAVLERHILRSGSKPTVYAHVTRDRDSGEYAVQYWCLYLFKYRLNEHESDWEQITVRLDRDANPIDAFYAAHGGGEIRPWETLQKRGDHPLAYVARGSHANYFAGGRHRVLTGCSRVVGSLSSCHGRTVVVDLTDGIRTLARGDYELSAFSGPVFIGSYGSGNYVLLTRKPDLLSDPRTRALWADPLLPLRQ